MTKKARKTAVSKASKGKTSRAGKRTAAKARSLAAPKKSRPAAKTISAAKRGTKPPESFLRKVAGAIKGVVDTLTEAEELHHRLDPDASRDVEPE